ncbi:MAG: LON peptidase substrate-binding domain-containing protein [Vicinamibacterales bacterium]
MSELLSLFPLPTTVLFPNVFLPLHVFEPRYRAMVADALASDRMIGMVLLREGWQQDYEGRPPVYPVGCSGVITHVETLTDGRYNLVLRGLDRFRIVSEDRDKPYRRAVVTPLPEPPPDPSARRELRQLRERLDLLIGPAVERSGTDAGITSAMPDDDLVNALAQYLDLEPVEKQALLELEGTPRRAAALVELLEMKLLMPRTGGAPRRAH